MVVYLFSETIKGSFVALWMSPSTSAADEIYSNRTTFHIYSICYLIVYLVSLSYLVSGSGPHRVPSRWVTLWVPQGAPHQATHPQPFPKVSDINVPHLGRGQKALQIDMKDVLLASTVPHGSQVWMFSIERFLSQSSPSKHQDPHDERRYLWSWQACC